MSDGDPFARIEELLAHLERVPDPGARELAQELVASVIELHRAALEKAVARAPAVFAELAADPGVAHVLHLHGLHPTPLVDRVRAALAAVPGVELLALDEGTAKLGVRGDPERTRATVARALLETAPDLDGFTLDGLDMLVPARSLVREVAR